MDIFILLFLIDIVAYLLVVKIDGLFIKREWDGQIRLIGLFNQFIVIIWFIYFLSEIDLVKSIVKIILTKLDSFVYLRALIQYLISNKLEISVFFSLLYIVFRVVLWFMVKSASYNKLMNEYNYKGNFQDRLIDFLNEDIKEKDSNIFWIDAEWGTGKTYFIKSFFEQQGLRKNEIYYLSCFGMKSRGDIEKLLLTEVEKKSFVGILKYVPIVGNLLHWAYRMMSIDVMKKNSIVIFDDLERVAFNGSPEEYNDILGFIDYLGSNRPYKLIVLLNSQDMEETYKKIIEPKFVPDKRNKLELARIIDSLVAEDTFDSENFASNVEKVISKPVNLRVLKRVISDYDNLREIHKDKILTEYLKRSIQVDLKPWMNKRHDMNFMIYWVNFIFSKSYNHFSYFVEKEEKFVGLEWIGDEGLDESTIETEKGKYKIEAILVILKEFSDQLDKMIYIKNKDIRITFTDYNVKAELGDIEYDNSYELIKEEETVIPFDLNITGDIVSGEEQANIEMLDVTLQEEHYAFIFYLLNPYYIKNSYLMLAFIYYFNLTNVNQEIDNSNIRTNIKDFFDNFSEMSPIYLEEWKIFANNLMIFSSSFMASSYYPDEERVLIFKEVLEEYF